MKTCNGTLLGISLAVGGIFAPVAAASQAYDHADRRGYKEIFDGVTLNGWDYAPEVWRVEDGAIVAGGIPGVDPGTTFASYREAEPADFDLLVDLKSEGTNTGIQFRSFRNPQGVNQVGALRDAQRTTLAAIDRSLTAQTSALAAARTSLNQAVFSGTATRAEISARMQAVAAAELALADARATAMGTYQGTANKLDEAQFSALRTRVANGGALAPAANFAAWNVAGYQADFPAVGTIWEGGRFANERGNLTTGGNITITDPTAGTRILAKLPTGDASGPFYKAGDWNQYHIMARGNVMILFLNGQLLSMTIDDNTSLRRERGIIALQIEGQGPVRFRNIWLKVVR